MDKIYRRPTQLGDTPKKKKDEKKRKRNTFINFRLTPVEREMVERRIALSGMTKAEFYIQSCMFQAILIKGNVKVFSEMKKQFLKIAKKIDREPRLEEMDKETLMCIKTILEILDKGSGKEK